MSGDFADRVYLASLDADDLPAAFGDGYATAAEPPAVSDLLRSLADTHAWATRDTDVLTTAERGDYVVFHRDFGVRAVGQVWETTADSDAVARHTDIEDPAGEWGLVTLTNVQPALDHVSLLSLDVDDARETRSLYRFDDDSASDLRDRYTTPARFVEELVANPLAFDVPPGGTPADRRPEPPDRGDSGVSVPETSVDAHLDALDAVRQTAWRVLALGAFMLAATLGVIQLYRVSPDQAFSLTPTVAGGVAAYCVGGAIATGVVLHGALFPRPGLPGFTREQANAAKRAGRIERGSAATEHLASATESYCAHVHTVTRWVGVAVASATVGVLVGSVYVAYGLGVQVSPELRPLGVVALGVFPALAVAATLFSLRQHVGSLTPDLPVGVDAPGLLSLPQLPGAPNVGRAVANALDAVRQRVAALTGRIR
jgi:hypothetical protein